MDISLHCGDCLQVLDDLIERNVKVDLIVTSPPYWKGFEYEAYFNSYSQYLTWCAKWLEKCKKLLNKNGTMYLNVINDSEITIRAYEIMEIATKDLMYKLHDTIIWYRYNQQPANTTRQLTNQQEFIFMLRHSSSGIELNKKDAYEKFPNVFKTKNVGNVWEIPFNSGKRENNGFGRKETKSKFGHSGFPIEIPSIPILLSTKENDTVLDLFMGSGTTGVACKNLNRNFIGIELDEKSFKIAKERING